jgi:hypothetical protein
MSHTNQLQFKGPFSYHAGTNGVDETFDVFCTKTNSHVISTNYWYHRLDAEVLAIIITHALNREFRPTRTRFNAPPSLLLRLFRDANPGPYRVRLFEDGHGDLEIGIAGRTLDSLLVSERIDETSTEVRSYFRWLADVLNRALGYPETSKTDDQEIY